MSSNLKPCPFCGNENVRRIPANGFPAAIVCDANHGGCGAVSGWHYYTDPAKDWNTRAERTCHVVIEDECPTCSECGEDIDPSFVACPYCGAKMVDND